MRLTNSDLNKKEIESLAEYSEWLLQLGEGKIPTISTSDYDEPEWINIPTDMLIDPKDDPIKHIIDSTYPDISTRYKDIDFMRDRCILTPKNENVEKINKRILDMIPTPSRAYLSADSISPLSANVNEQDILYTTEYLNKKQISGVPNHVIELKIGVPIMLMRNINPSGGMCNGTTRSRQHEQ